MGFGLLFIGYTLLLTIGKQINLDLGLGIDVLPDVIGYVFFLLGLKNLRPYSKNFVIARWLTIPLIIIGGVIFSSELIALLGYWQKPIAVILSYLEYIHIPVLVFFHIYLCMGIKELAGEVGLPKIVHRSLTAMLLTTVRYLAGMLLPDSTSSPIIAMIAILLPYITYFFMLYLLFSCYARIIYADQEEKATTNPIIKVLEKNQKNK